MTAQTISKIPNLQWLSDETLCKVLDIKIKTLREYCQCGKYIYRVKRIKNKVKYFVLSDSLPQKVLNKLHHDKQGDRLYSEAPSWAKLQVEKYIDLLKATKHIKGKELKAYIENWNINHPDKKTSYPCVIRMRNRYDEFGTCGLLSQKGQINRSSVNDKYFDYFKILYLKEGAPSVRSCWDQTLGFAILNDNIDREQFPSHTSFMRRLEREVPQQSIYLARHGQSAWNRKYGSYIDRNYSNIACGKVWVSDHAQIDVACMTKDGNVVFPWVTAWRDFKSGKWLGWYLQSGSPNSDHIFQTFFYAAETYGLPEDVIIDNGKDYRCKDFAGGRRVIRVEANRTKTTAMLDELNVNVNFALPYNAQTKPIERDFLKIKELLSKHCVGYRGGNVVERPEVLADEIKKGKILSFDKFKEVFDDFVINILNKRPSEGKNLKGLSPDEVFNAEFNEKITTSRDALKLFCMRTSRNFTIGRNGIQDRELGITYWADWMISQTGLKVYLRRDPQNYKVAWAFRADNEEFVGTINAIRAVAALHAETVSKEEFKEAMANKKRNLKIAKAYIQQSREISIEERCENYKAAYAKVIKDAQPRVTKIANTNMDKAIRKNAEMQAYGKADLSKLLDKPKVNEKPFYLFETDKILDEELKGVASGY